jgi:hypothetical protein
VNHLAMDYVLTRFYLSIFEDHVFVIRGKKKKDFFALAGA